MNLEMFCLLLLHLISLSERERDRERSTKTSQTHVVWNFFLFSYMSCFCCWKESGFQMGMSPFELAIPFLFMEQSFIGKGMTKTQSVFLSLDIRSIHFGVHVGRSNAICVECWTKNSIPQYWFSRGQANNHLAGFFVVVPITPLTVRPEDWVKLLAKSYLWAVENGI